MENKNWFRRHWILSTIIGIILLSIVISNFSRARDKGQQTADLVNRQQEQVKTPAVFDISDLLGKGIDDVVAKLGQPKSKYTPKTNIESDTPDMTFSKNNLEMIVTYDAKTRTVIDFFLPSASDHSNLNSDEDKNIILNNLNLVDNSPNYEVKYVKALKDPNMFTGVIVKKIDPLASTKKIAVERIAKNLIKESLKAPSTAKFSLFPSTKTTDGKTFVVSQSVDSQNSFGAMLNTYFDVTIKYIGEENSTAIHEDYNWKVMKVESDGEVIYSAK